jgi:hypothetical protein
MAMTTAAFALGGVIQWCGAILALGVSVGVVLLVLATLAHAVGTRASARKSLAQSGTDAGQEQRTASPGPPLWFRWLSAPSFLVGLLIASVLSIWPLQLDALHLLMPLQVGAALANTPAASAAGGLMVGLPAGLIAWWLAQRLWPTFSQARRL